MENKKMIAIVGGTLVLIGALVISAYFLFSRNTTKEPIALSMVWGEWAPSDILEMMLKEYEDETGARITLTQIPWGSYYNELLTGLQAEVPPYDIAIGDSQWIGAMVQKGYYRDITDFVVESRIIGTMDPRIVKHYAEYPRGSETYYAVPALSEGVLLAYRSDILEDENEKAAFAAAYGYPLAVPHTWNELRDIAEFFTRPEEGMYGLAIPTDENFYDAITMLYGGLLYAYGAAWGDFENRTADGIINDPRAAEALSFMKSLYAFTEKIDTTGNGYDWFESAQFFAEGKSVLVVNYPSVLDGYVKPGTSHYNAIGYSALPFGPSRRASSLGGQPFSIVSGIEPEKVAAAEDFLRWWTQERVQRRWTELGGYALDRRLLLDPIYEQQHKKAKALKDTLEILEDFWNEPEFPALLETFNAMVSTYAVDDSEGTVAESQAVLDRLNEAWKQILR